VESNVPYRLAYAISARIRKAHSRIEKRTNAQIEQVVRPLT
jgi:hypothetical protein